MRLKRFGVLIVLTTTVLFSCQNGKNRSDHLVVTAHRGASGLAPENTLAAMLKAMQLGADYAELDVQEIADGSLVIFHDDTLQRTTNLNGHIWKMTQDEIKKADAGSWFHTEFAGEPIPTLQTVIDAVRSKMKLNIELKLHGHEKRLVEQVVELVQENDFVSQCMLTSFDRESVRKVKQLNPAITTGFIFSEMPEEDIFNAEFEIFSVHKRVVTAEFVTKAHEHQKKVHVWTVNEPEEMQKLIGMQVDGIITNYPHVLTELLKKYP